MIIAITDKTNPNGSLDKDITMQIGVQTLSAKKYPYEIRQKYGFGLQTPTRGMLVHDEGEPLAKLQPEERLYILGHGESQANTLSGKTPKELLNHLISRGLDLTRDLRIVLVSCNAGVRLSGPSYAEQFYDEIMKWWQWNCMPSEISFMEKTGAFPSVWIKAPKGLISLSSPYGKPSIIPTEHVDEYRRQSTKLEKVKATVESDDSEVVRKAEHEFDQWINLHMTVTKRTDWQFIPMISKDHTWGLPD